MAAIPPLGASDCEAIREGFLAQPANAISSLGFSVVGVAVYVWAGRASGIERRFRLVLGSAMAAAGVGSFIYHGPQTSRAAEAHDWSLIALVALLGMWVALARTSVVEWLRWTIVGAAVLALIVLSELTGNANAAFVVAVALTVGSDVVMHRRIRRQKGLYAMVGAVGVLAVGAFLVGRTGAALCDPESALQFHAIWHMLAAITVGLYALASEPIRARIPS